MTIKPLISDTILRHIDEDNRKFFRSNIACVTIYSELYRFGNEDIIPYPVISYCRKSSSYTELLVYIPELLVDFFNYCKQYEPSQFYPLIRIDISPIVGSSVTLIHDPLNLMDHIIKLASKIEQEDILKHFNDEESKCTSGVVKEKR